ncbi:MAG: hypothetical protein E6248_02805 [Clostridium sp.]|uniref:hypothetical protein n=1 Tax=Clostridium sp. TaxID=1506 RepID=UPI00290E4116|nr:hypothetical protein [Clostridium sp.]MDU5109349.1 hypothetical protein [Clostridium sp.]
MENRKNSYYLVRYKPNILLKFSYKESIGIYYELIKDGKRLEGKIIHKSAFRHFNIVYSKDSSINLICQDICGDIILYKLRKGKWSFKALLYMKYNKISPINFYSYENNQQLRFLYSDIDCCKGEIISVNFNKYLEYESNNIILRENNINYLDYRIFSNSENNFILISTKDFSRENLIIRKLDIEDEMIHFKEEIIMENYEYEDMSFLPIDQKCHFLFLKEYDKLRTINYKVFYNKDEKYYSNEFELFKGIDIKSCILVKERGLVFAFWICENNLYSAFLIDEEKGFSRPVIYRNIKGENIKKIYLYNGDKTMETYVLEDALELRLIIEEVFEERVFNITTNYI